ncbi:MAG: sigma-54-dependent Fis family transcriptional regulator [Proteobacteria bacterium]|nr:sigma-54-dependent Fis family transcriptional regulator [Pseudomonadota bacterium]MCP4918403.1 sigma-54-dependent Fis family transcriptional regulator [Pseudomonadota bacterium]
MPVQATLLVVDDEELIRWSVNEHMRAKGFRVVEAEDGVQALKLVEEHAPDVILTDLNMPKMGGLQFLRALRESGRDTPVVVLTAHGGVDSAVEATQLGATGYLAKPFDLREVALAVEKALDNHRLAREVHYLRGRQTAHYGSIIGESPAMQKLFDVLRRLEDVEAPTVLLTGESGTGKDLIAHAIHESGPRKSGPMMEVDCAALPEQLIESELFGHERGSFTDAKQTKRGLFEVARGGTIFLDEIGEMSQGTQAKLLRALESRCFKRVGGVSSIRLDAGVIAATNRDLGDEVAKGNFREDLYFRLNVIRVQIPSLRERREDVGPLCEHFIERFAREFRRDVRGISGEALERLRGYGWPGNVRELRNLIERMVILDPHEIIEADHLPAEVRYSRSSTTGSTPFVLPEEGVDLEEVEKSLLQQALDRTGGNQSAAARLLGISRYALRYRIEKHGLA